MMTTHIPAALVTLLVLSLVGCGGGSDNASRPPCLGHYIGSGFCTGPLVYTVGGTVSGLAGSKLELTTYGYYVSDTAAISANGSFVFSAKYAEGDDYDVFVSAQPGNPSQTCLVTNGAGTVGSSNVVNISVSCTTGVANAKLTGTYTAVDYSSAGESGRLWTVTFDGVGQFSAIDIRNNTGTVDSITISGTYTVAADGTLNISVNGGSTLTGGLATDGSTWVISQTTADGYMLPEILVGIKQGAMPYSSANLTGAYTAAHYGYASTGDSSGLWTVTFDGAGNFSGTDIVNNAGIVSSAAVSGTYAIAPNGALTITPDGGSTITGGLSADGITWVASQLTAGVSPEILVGIKQGSMAYSSASLNGTYAAAHYGYRSIGGLWAVVFDGAGTFSGTDYLNSTSTTSSVGISGTYTVAVDGALNLHVAGDPAVTGGVSADGNTWVGGQPASGEMPSILVGVLRVPP
jgi:hypothetical protein